MTGRPVRGPLAAALALALSAAGCSTATQPCALYDCGGACVDVRVDGAHCGACGHACQAGAVCSGGSCELTCEVPLSTCGAPGARFCAALSTEAANCGACGVTCPAGQVCALGTCTPACPAALTACGAGQGAWCADLARDRLNCGVCGHACPPGSTCDAGGCVGTCQGAGRAACDGACVDLYADALHCGACGHACQATEICDGAACRDTCAAAGLARCGDACLDLSSDPLHCGACGTACADGHTCQAGRCAPAACAGGPSLSGPPDLLLSLVSGGVTAADLDGDGRADLLLTELGSGRLWLARGLPGGGFGEAELAFAEAAAPGDLEDVDGDGDLDVLALGDTGLVWLVNDGAGHLARGDAYPMRLQRFARAVDLDGDGTLEVVAADTFFLTVWRHGPAGPAETYSPGSIRDLAVGDLDGDGRPDLVLACRQGCDPVSVLHNQGDGTFVPWPGADPGHTTDTVTVADLNGDGRPDVASRGFSNGPTSGETLAVMLGTPAGLGPAAVHLLPAASSRFATLAVDLDADADLDLVLDEAGTARLFVNRGDGTFGEPELVRTGPARGVAALDADGDGLADLVAASMPGPGVAIRRRLAGDGWAGPALLAVPSDQVLITDLDGDGRDELVTLRQADTYAGLPRSTIEVRRGGPAGLGPPAQLSGFWWARMQVADLDGDGAAELLVSRSIGQPGLLRFRDGVLQDELPVVVPGMERLVQLADVTGDGLLDLVRSPVYWPYLIRVAPGLGQGRFGAPVDTPSITSFDAFALADLDGDGRADLTFVTGYGTRTLNVLAGRADGTFGEARLVDLELPTSFAAVWGPAAADLDGDGRVELTFGVAWSRPWPQPDAAQLALLEDEAGTLTVTMTPVVSSPELLTAAPVRQAGRPDLLLVGRHALTLLERQADGRFGAERRWSAPDARGLAAAGDLDGDGRLEVAVPVIDGLLLYRGGCAP